MDFLSGNYNVSELLEKGKQGDLRLGFDTLTINITNKCNLKCVWCDYREDESFASTLTFDQFKRNIVPTLKNKPKFEWIDLTSGGEVFVNNDLAEIVNFLRSEFPDKKISLVSNAMFKMSEKVLNVYRSIDRLTISIDGSSKQVFESIRYPAKFEVFLHNVSTIIEAIDSNKTDVMFAVTVGAKNIHELKGIVELAANLKKVSSIWVQPVVLTNDNIAIREEKHDLRNLSNEVILKHLSDAKVKAEELNVKLYSPDDNSFLGAEDPQKLDGGCYHPWVKSPLVMDDYIMPCCFIDSAKHDLVKSRYDLSSPAEESVEDIYNSKDFWRFREDLKNNKCHDICGDCPARFSTKLDGRVRFI